jgi:hypothetical protein
MRIILLVFRGCMLPLSAWSNNYHKPWNINIFLSISYKVLPEFPFSFPSCKTLQNSWDRLHMGIWHHRHSWHCTRTNHRVLFRWCWTVSDSADTTRPPSAVRYRSVWDIARGLWNHHTVAKACGTDRQLQWTWSGRTAIVWHWTGRSLQWTLSIHHYSGYGADGILQWTWSRRITAVDMEQSEYYSGNRADGSLLWTWNNQSISWVLTDWLLQ